MRGWQFGPRRPLWSAYDGVRCRVSNSYAASGILDADPSSGRAGEREMAHFLVSDERYRRVVYGDDLRSPRADLYVPGSYRFGRVPCKSARGNPRRIGGAFRRAIEAIVNSKLRRMERELELRGIQTRDPR